jgi:hypothetical protein
LHELIEDRSGGRDQVATVSAPAPVIDLLSALKRSLAKESPAKAGRAGKGQRTKATPDRRQASLLLPVSGGRKIKEQLAEELSTAGTRPRRKA